MLPLLDVMKSVNKIDVLSKSAPNNQGNLNAADVPEMGLARENAGVA